jgi:putative endonuclease
VSVRAWIAERFRTPTFGELGERHAARFLERLGYTVVARRYRNRFGEFDLVAVDGETVVFVEVKSRRTEAGIRPADSVGHVRQQRMIRAATAYLKRSACSKARRGSTSWKSSGQRTRGSR